MIKHNLKLNDTFLVTVEILTADAIIVSANINSVIFRGTLIRCNKNSQCLFKKLPEKELSFSSNRIDIKNLKRQIRFKTFKSTYNLRRTNNKIIKAKKQIIKSEPKCAENLSVNNNKPLSIKLKRDNGVYINASSTNDNKLSNNPIIPKSDFSCNKRTANIIKIVKTKLKSNKYQYSIINKSNNDTDLSNEHPSESKVLKLCLTPLIQISESSESICSHIQNSSADIKLEKFDPPKWDFYYSPSQSIPIDTNGIKFEPTLDPPKSPNKIISPEKCIEIIPENPLLINENKTSSVKLKIVKNGSKPNSYAIKPLDKTENIKKRYNCKKFSIGDIVWAKLSGYSIWPAKVIDLASDGNNATVMWLGDDYRTSQLLRWKLLDFGAHFHEKFNKKRKGNYMNAVQQAQIEYSKLDFNSDSTSSWFFDISSESSTLESVNIDEGSCELDRMSNQESRPNIYLPLPDEEFELMRPSSKSVLSDFLSFDCSDSSRLDNKSVRECKFHLNSNDIVDYNFI